MAVIADSRPPVPNRRAFHVINLSLPKTGSASLARVFGNYRSIHEMAHIDSVDTLLDWREDRLCDAQLDSYLLSRDARARPELDCATFLHLAADRLPGLFPEARFAVVIRPCADWAASFLGMMLEAFGVGGWGGNLPDVWVRRYGRHVSPSLADLDLRSRFDVAVAGPSLAWELADYWGRRTLATLAAAPPSRTLVLGTTFLDEALESLSNLAGVPADSLYRNVHLNRGSAAADARALLRDVALKQSADRWQPQVTPAVERSAAMVDPRTLEALR